MEEVRTRLRIRDELFRFVRPEGAKNITEQLRSTHLSSLSDQEEIVGYDDGTLYRLFWSTDMTCCDLEVNRVVEISRDTDGVLEVRVIPPERFHW